MLQTSPQPLRRNNEANWPFFQYDQTSPQKNGYSQNFYSRIMKKEPLYVAFLGKMGMEGTQNITCRFFLSSSSSCSCPASVI